MTFQIIKAIKSIHQNGEIRGGGICGCPSGSGCFWLGDWIFMIISDLLRIYEEYLTIDRDLGLCNDLCSQPACKSNQLLNFGIAGLPIALAIQVQLNIHSTC